MSEEVINLPPYFKQLEYLESNGSQWIDTGYIPNNETGFFVDAEQITHSNGVPVASGCDRNSPADGIMPPRWLKSTNNSAGFCWGEWFSWGNISNGGRFISKLNFYNDKKAYLETLGDNPRQFSRDLSELTFTPTKSILFFKTSVNPGVTDYNWYGRIYEVKITQDTEIVRDFIPAINLITNKPCMFDLVTQTAYYNQGSGEFIYYYEEPIVSIPYGYKRCLYLESTGTQYIDTNIIPTTQTGAYAKWSLTNIKNYSNVLACLGNSTDDTADNVFMLPHWNGYNNAYLGGFMSRTSGVLRLENQTAPTLQSTHESYLNYHNNGQALIDTTLLGNVDNTYENLENDLPLYLFGCNKLNSLSTGDSMIGRIYRATITEGEEVVMDLIPCLDDNGKPCMYDLVTQIPFYNANAEGDDFRYVVKGKIPSWYKRLKYLKSTGTQYINTGIVTDGTYTISTKFVVNDTFGNVPIWGRTGNANTGESQAVCATTSQHLIAFQYVWRGGLYQWKVDLSQPHEYVFTEGQQSVVVDGNTVQLQHMNTSAVNASNLNRKSHYLFASNGWNNKACVDFYYFRMQNGSGKIVLDFVPALDENGRPCMYDLVEGIPYYNAGTGEFKCPPGSLETDYKKYCTLGVIGNRLGTGEDGLPPTYKRVNYLQSTGTQYIDTGIATDGTYTIRAKMQLSWNTAFGRAFKTADYDIGGCSFCRRVTTSGYYCMNFLYYWNGGVFGNRPNFTDVEWDINVPNIWEAKEGENYVLVNGQHTYIRSFNTLKIDASNPNNLTHYVFWANGVFTNGNAKGIMKLYDFQMINSSEKIVLDLIPCLDTKGTPCMFDRIANKTFYNQGTGEFLYG